MATLCDTEVSRKLTILNILAIVELEKGIMQIVAETDEDATLRISRTGPDRSRFITSCSDEQSAVPVIRRTHREGRIRCQSRQLPMTICQLCNMK